MPEELPVYLPNPKTCHTEQYQCCKYSTHCRLYSACSQIQKTSVCKRDCPVCNYGGCSLSAEQRCSSPVYIAGVIQKDRIELNLERRYWQEHQEHLQRHKKLYYFYNCFFGDYRQLQNARNRNAYHENIEVRREKNRISQKRQRAKNMNANSNKQRKYTPECQFDCENCKYPDCILPLDWEKRMYAAKRKSEDPEYYARYYRNNREKLRAYGKRYYKENRDKVRAHQKEYYQQPEVKARRAERAKQYAQSHREELKAYKAEWYRKNKDKINAKRRKT